jgi:hypothetical protein
MYNHIDQQKIAEHTIYYSPCPVGDERPDLKVESSLLRSLQLHGAPEHEAHLHFWFTTK